MRTNHVNWRNPYAERGGIWYKGNLHAHSSPASKCGTVALERVLALYRQHGYDFLSVSDHMVLSAPRDDELILVPGLEWNSVCGQHTGVYSIDPTIVEALPSVEAHEELLNGMAGKDAVVILNHPNWQSIPHYRREQLDESPFFDGIEIYNAVIERLPGEAIATDKWDYLLEQGKRVLGFASDDSHAEQDIGNAWIAVRAPERSLAAVFRGIRQGNFYCSSGVVLSDIRKEGSVITIESENADEFMVIAAGGRRIVRSAGDAVTVDISEWETEYVRFAAYGAGSAMAWTQPFFAG